MGWPLSSPAKCHVSIVTFLYSDRGTESLWLSAVSQSNLWTCRLPVAHISNPRYSRGRDQENCGLKPARANSSLRPYLKKPFTKKGLVEWLKVTALSSSSSTRKKKKKKIRAPTHFQRNKFRPSKGWEVLGLQILRNKVQYCCHCFAGVLAQVGWVHH
jgi:hypothetical protein